MARHRRLRWRPNKVMCGLSMNLSTLQNSSSLRLRRSQTPNMTKRMSLSINSSKLKLLLLSKRVKIACRTTSRLILRLPSPQKMPTKCLLSNIFSKISWTTAISTHSSYPRLWVKPKASKWATKRSIQKSRTLEGSKKIPKDSLSSKRWTWKIVRWTSSTEIWLNVWLPKGF